jgi:hypothetical protein
VPTGWSIASDDDDSLAVIELYPWSATVVLTQGSAYCSSVCGTSNNYGSGYLQSTNEGYYSTICTGQILIREYDTTFVF